MKILLIPVFLIFIIFFMSVPDAFGVTHLVNVPMGAAGGINNFDPNIVKIEKGDTVKWTIFDRGIHTVTSDTGLFDSGPMQKMDRQSDCATNSCEPFPYTFNEGGTYNYRCTIHSWMQGSVVVQDLGSNAARKSCGSLGCVYVDKMEYGINPGRTIQVEIYGLVNDVKSNDKVYMTINGPFASSSTSDIKDRTIFVTRDGKFSYPEMISYDKRGTYTITVYDEPKMIGKIGTVTFDVVKTSTTQKSLVPTSIRLDSNKDLYKNGDDIVITGVIQYTDGPFTQSNQNEVYEPTVQIISPNGNVVSVDQIKLGFSKVGNDEQKLNLYPNMFQTIITTGGTLWNLEGVYKIKATYGNLQQSQHFSFSFSESSGFSSTPDILTSTTKTSTFLRLDPIASTFKSLGPNLGADVVLSGTLLTSDRNSVITGAKIKLIDTKFNKSVTVTTDKEGKFNAIWNWAVGNNYGIYAAYDGSLNFGPSESKQELFQVTRSAIQPQPPIPPSSGFDLNGLFSLVIVAVVIVAIVAAVKRRKKTPIPPIPAGGGGGPKPKPQPSAPPSGDGPSLIGRKACPNCHWLMQLPTNQNRTQTCNKCGWKTGDHFN